ncbi:hypothetical protein Syun_005549 [Stephania yunnanensis]|uniref:Dehydrin n=1 Tax=Stephania yunnanensis TaxID=152371 RepID=A0AAP0Q1U9_9MAGN
MSDYEPKVEGGEAGGEVKDRGLFDFLAKKEDDQQQHHHHEETSKPCTEQESHQIASEFEEKVQVAPPLSYPDVHHEEKKKVEEEEEKKPSLIEKLHRSGSSSSSSSSEEEVEEDGQKIKRKKKKGLKEKIKEKICGDKEEGEQQHQVPVEEGTPIPIIEHHEEKKGFLEKIKEKLPGGHKKEECGPAADAAVVTPPAHHVPVHEEESKEKKGLLEKIKEKLPGYHKADHEPENKKETTTDY